MLQITKTTDDKIFSIPVNENEKNQNASSGVSSVSSGGIGGSIENLSIVAKLAKSKKSKLAKSKKSDLTNSKKSTLPNAKTNSGTDFLIPEAKKVFIHLQKAFRKALIFCYFNLEHYICIEIDVLGYTICGVLSQMISDYPD